MFTLLLSDYTPPVPPSERRMLWDSHVYSLSHDSIFTLYMDGPSLYSFPKYAHSNIALFVGRPAILRILTFSAIFTLAIVPKIGYYAQKPIRSTVNHL